MAEEKLDEDLDLGEEKGGGSNKKLFILIGAGVLVMLLAGLGAGWFMFSGGDDQATEEEVVEEEEPAEEKGPAIYHPLDPVFVVNLPPGGSAKMLQIGVQVVGRDEELIGFLKHNDPMVRHNLLTLFGSQDAEKLRKSAGKEKLQQEVLKKLNKIVKDHKGPSEVEAVYFTSFVMQ